jgi:hypothetical protein
VSLRDVERVLQVMSWFYSQNEDDHLLFCRMRDELSDDSEEKIVNHQQVHTSGKLYYKLKESRG